MQYAFTFIIIQSAPNVKMRREISMEMRIFYSEAPGASERRHVLSCGLVGRERTDRRLPSMPKCITRHGQYKKIPTEAFMPLMGIPYGAGKRT